MRLNDKLEKAFNDQVTLELQASNVYRQLAIELDRLDLNGMAKWMRAQSEEEIVHAEKFIDHLAARDNHAQLGAITAPEFTVDKALDAFRIALDHEEKVSAAIRDLWNLAADERDVDSRPLLDFFIKEQIEEEDNVRNIIGRIELIGADGHGLLRIDEELGARREELN
ncbi:ferritin [uncultured Corynebacterium sp.]|uniref:ferritin n=1 Tax=uncultured Corynebacterium sp. TaxID=159447 RepID=UPI0025D3AE93|nr:ferritin [uncultured Corynebacterium sp.]